ncbi:MAG: hypothetical protein Q4E38_03695 [Eubacteriales bacterium]|nr:hypothetical protein [Eubacteriales bacterium]
MERADKAYYEAIEELDAAVKAARRKHKEVIGKLKAAEGKVNESRNLSDRYTEQHLQKEMAKIALDKIKREIRPQISTIWQDFDTTAAQIRRKLVADLEEADTYRASDMDMAAVALLNSGTMRLKDFQNMATEFSENPTVLALLRKTAREAAEKMTDEERGQERGLLMDMANNARTDSEKLLKGYDDLNYIARMFSGRDSNGNFESGLSGASLDAWERATEGVIPRDGSESE